MSFHKDMFHEMTVNLSKQKALRYIDYTQKELLKLVKDNTNSDKLMSAIHNKLNDIKYFVNDI